MNPVKMLADILPPCRHDMVAVEIENKQRDLRQSVEIVRQ